METADSSHCFACDHPLRSLWSASDWRASGTQHRWLECVGCGQLYLADGRRDFEPSGSGTDAGLYSDDDRLHQQLQKWLLFPERVLVTSALPERPHLRLLEVGCGTGLLARTILDHHPHIAMLGIEPRPEAACRAREAGVDVVATSVETAQLTAESVDAVIFIHVLEHFPDPIAVLRRTGEYLRADGALILSLPVADSWEARLFGSRWYGLRSPEHEWIPTHRSVALILAKAGFRMETMSYRSYRTPLVGFVASLVPGLEPSRLRRLAARAPLRARVGQVIFAALMILVLPLVITANALGRGSSVAIVARQTPRRNI